MTVFLIAHPIVEWAGIILFALITLFFIGMAVWYWPGDDSCLAALHREAKAERKRHD